MGRTAGLSGRSAGRQRPRASGAFDRSGGSAQLPLGFKQFIRHVRVAARAGVCRREIADQHRSTAGSGGNGLTRRIVFDLGSRVES